EGISDFIWVIFNCYFVYLSYKFVFVKLNLFWKSQTMGIPMKYFYYILPFAFVLMAIRVIQVNWIKWVRGEEVKDPDAIDLDDLEKPNN
ncbi:MAG: TRAP transporter small permease subunit, partial [Desulfobacterales bacterium]|nr:TRAP transporter small permease subunit [Desulfobacterales bacterium]